MYSQLAVAFDFRVSRLFGIFFRNSGVVYILPQVINCSQVHCSCNRSEMFYT